MVNIVATLLKKLVSVVLLGGLVGVVAYAMVKPESAPDTRDRPGRGRGGAGVGGSGVPAVPVLAASAQRTNVPVVLEGVGTVRPLNTVTVRPQVDGRILKVAFREGQDVKPGDLLAEIDPATYKAALDQAVARRAITETQLVNARRDYDRMAKIPSVMAQKTMDTQQAQVDQLEAQLKADDAAIATTRTVLGYTRITSPISGRTGFRLVDEGNLVRAGDAGIVTITEIDPIAVVFTLPQQRLPDVRRALERGPVEVEAMDIDGRRKIATGRLDVLDNQIDPQTGTIKIKAVFANPGRELWPGQFANVRVTVDRLDDVVAVPTAAVQRGPAGTFVWVVGPESTATVRPVETGLQTETLAVVKTGLQGGEQIVTTGFARISEGARLVVREAPVEAPVGYAAPARIKGGGKGKGRREATEGKPGEQGGGAARGAAAPGTGSGAAKGAVQ
ncbi:MAG: efflux RND transporter periplasmic adaptor subunit [Hyphomicrobiaceae bacterium]|nr:efflux RND transporter periplasmic adaptor subunit [Hyphomicrobiaceae bacterium]